MKRPQSTPLYKFLDELPEDIYIKNFDLSKDKSFGEAYEKSPGKYVINIDFAAHGNNKVELVNTFKHELGHVFASVKFGPLATEWVDHNILFPAWGIPK